MNIIGKQYLSSQTGKSHIVKNISEDNVVFLDGQTVKIQYLFNPSYYNEIPNKPYSERIDPESFFARGEQAAASLFVNGIRKISNDVVENMPGDPGGNKHNYTIDNSSAVVPYDEEYEKELLAEKYNLNTTDIRATQAANKQVEAFSRLLNEDEAASFKKNVPPPIYKSENDRETSIIVDSAVEVKTHYTQNNNASAHEDPIIVMFKKAKRKTDFKILLEVENKIPVIDFIELMEETYEDNSIIEYLADEFTDKILSDRSFIKNKIVEELTLLLNNKEPHDKIFKKGGNLKKILKEDSKPVEIKLEDVELEISEKNIEE